MQSDKSCWTRQTVISMFTDIPETPVCRAFIPSSNMGGVVAVFISEEGGGKSTFNLSFPRANSQDCRESIYLCKLNVAEINRHIT